MNVKRQKRSFTTFTNLEIHQKEVVMRVREVFRKRNEHGH